MNWCNYVKDLLHKYGSGYVWINLYCVNHKNSIKVFKFRVIDEFHQTMYSHISNSTVLTTYRYLKTNSGIEKNLNALPCKLFNYISKLRLSSHSLRIETGSYGNDRIERNQ